MGGEGGAGRILENNGGCADLKFAAADKLFLQRVRFAVGDELGGYVKAASSGWVLYKGKGQIESGGA